MKLGNLFSAILTMPEKVRLAVRRQVQIALAMILTSPLMAKAALPDNIMKEILSADSTMSMIKGVLTVIAITLILGTIYSFKEGNKEAMVIMGALAGFTVWLIADWDTFLGWIAG